MIMQIDDFEVDERYPITIVTDFWVHLTVDEDGTTNYLKTTTKPPKIIKKNIIIEEWRSGEIVYLNMNDSDVFSKTDDNDKSIIRTDGNWSILSLSGKFLNQKELFVAKLAHKEL